MKYTVFHFTLYSCYCGLYCIFTYSTRIFFAVLLGRWQTDDGYDKWGEDINEIIAAMPTDWMESVNWYEIVHSVTNMSPAGCCSVLKIQYLNIQFYLFSECTVSMQVAYVCVYDCSTATFFFGPVLM